MSLSRPRFRDLFDQAYGRDLRERAFSITKSLEARGSTPLFGHPDYEHLAIGETEPGTIVAFFMDIRGFTKLAFALDPTETVQILQATLAASIACVEWHGGHVADLTGDGIMALFGGRRSTAEIDALNAVSAAAMMMRGIKEVVTQYLLDQGHETVRVGMGLEYGEVTWTRLGLPSASQRLGLPSASQVKPISGISFLAGKLSTAKYTRSWECKIGQNLAEWLPDVYKTKAPRYTFQYKGRTYTHDLYLFDWAAFHDDLALRPYTLSEELTKSRRLPRSSRAAIIGAAGLLDPAGGTRPSGGPRPLKDRPFFGEVK